MRLRTVAAVLVVIVTLLALVAPYVRSYTRAAALITGMMGMEGPVADVLAIEGDDFTVSDVMVPSRHGPMRAHLYVPDHVKRAVVLVPGLHAIGIDEPRVYNLAMQMARVGWAVLTPQVPDMARYAITPRTTDDIEDAAVWLAGQQRVARHGRIGMVGISFAGGLSVVAAGRPALRDHVAFVFSFGGHASLPRVLRYLCTGLEPADLPPAGAPTNAPVKVAYLRPHDYGVAVLLLEFAAHVVPPEQAGPLREAVLEFLTASCYDLVNLKMALLRYTVAEGMADALPEPSRTLMRYVNTRDVEKLGPILLPHMAEVGYQPSVSADLSPAPNAPVYLLHGTGDNVVPAIETRFLARYLEGKTPVRALLSGLITHAELNSQRAWAEAWKLIDFFASLLRA
jgi:fermentation-respiration switch protein FrsA (DUF1100 family)